MRSFAAAGALTAALLTSSVSADLCSAGSQNINGNWYCQPVHRIHYTGVGSAGTYNKITSMNSQDGSCSSVPFSFSGPNAPLDEDVSLSLQTSLIFVIILGSIVHFCCAHAFSVCLFLFLPHPPFAVEGHDILVFWS